MDILGRYRNLIVLMGVLFAQVLGLAVQVKRATASEPTRLIRVWAVGAVTPFEEVLHGLQTSSGNVWHNYLYLRGVRAENRELKQEIQQLRLGQVRMTQDADQARRLQALLEFKEQFISKTMAAQVIGWSGSEQSRSIYIDKGAREGIRPDMAVITKDGIVGKVLQVFGGNPLERSVSQVLLIDDQTSGVGAILDKARLQGILRGTPSGDVVLEKVMSDETVPVGEQVLTSGGDGIFPKGLPVGTVTRVSPGGDLFLNIRVRPTADLSRLEEVLVVTKIDERQAEPEQGGPARAVDILAERLPTVPPKPEPGPEGAGKGPIAVAGGTATTAAAAASAHGAKPGDTSPKSTSAPGIPGPVVPKAVPGGGTTSPSAPKAELPHATVSSVGIPSTGAVVNPSPTVKKAVASNVAFGPNPVGSTPAAPAATHLTAATTAATAAKPAAAKPVVHSTTTSKPQPAAQDTPQ
ncbi:MAG: rod shape-determining protein MreC [Terriglobales bacterium]|jgi:rod shape-determining protein MreC